MCSEYWDVFGILGCVWNTGMGSEPWYVSGIPGCVWNTGICSEHWYAFCGLVFVQNTEVCVVYLDLFELQHWVLLGALCCSKKVTWIGMDWNLLASA